MAQYQKILQLYRTTNIWNTKNIAKAEVEIHAKLLHEELEAQLRDGEPIVAKYYDEPESGYAYSYTSLSSKDPYQGTNSSLHYWVNGVDKFNSNEVTISGDTLTAIKGAAPSYDSPAYVWVVNGSTNSYFKLNVEVTGSPSRGESAVFGIALTVDDTNNIFTIEWFDSESEAKGAISDINYEDHDLENGFVAKVNQKDGKIESIHGTISAEKAIAVTQDAYTYVKLDNSRTIPSDYIWDEYDEGADLPEEINENSPKYYHVTTGDNAEYYELRKNIDISLVINDDNNVLAEGSVTKWKLLSGAPTEHTFVDGETFPSIPTITSSSPEYIRVGTGESDYRYYQKETTSSNSGLSTNFTLRSLSPTEVSDLGSNVRDAYKLVGNANGTETTIGDTIKIYKDTSLIKVYLGHIDDTINTQTGVITPGVGNDALCFVYKLADDTYTLVAVDVESFLSENEFHDGLEVITGNYHYDDYYETPEVPGTYWIEGTTSFATEEAARGITASAVSPSYLRYGTDPNWSYLIKEGTGNEIAVKLATDGGIDFKDEGVNLNKSLKIKIDNTDSNKYYKKTTDQAPQAGVTYYTYNVSTNQYDQFTGQTFDTNTAYYVKDQYLYTTSNGLSVNQAVLENKITDNVGKVLFVNKEPFVKDNDGNIKAIVIGEDITVAGVGSNDQSKPMTNIVLVDGIVPVPQSSLPTPSDTTPDYVLLTAQAPYVLYKKGTNTYEFYTTQNNDEYIEVNGFIYHLNGGKYELYFINKDTNLNDAISILNYLTYNLDMGQFTVTY